MKEKSKKQGGIYIPTAFKAIFIATVALFVIIALTLGGFLIADIVSDGGSEPIQTDGGGSSNKKDPSTKDTDSVQAGIVTPSGKKPLYQTATTRDNYLSTSDASTADASSLISSKSTILVEVGSNTSVAEKNADLHIYPASMTKVMTLVVVCENITQADLSKKLEVPLDLVEFKHSIDGSGEDLKEGEKYTIKDLIYLMSYKSDTVASMMLAEYIAEATGKDFAELMNKTAQKIGMTNSHFANSTGLHNENNYSTCRDMAALMVYALDSEFTRNVLVSEKYAMESYESWTLYPGWYSGDGARFTYKTQRLNTVKVMGGKTGFEDIPRYTLVTYAKGYDGKEYVNVTVSRETENENATTLAEHISDVKKIYNTYAK